MQHEEIEDKLQTNDITSIIIYSNSIKFEQVLLNI